MQNLAELHLNLHVADFNNDGKLYLASILLSTGRAPKPPQEYCGGS